MGIERIFSRGKNLAAAGLLLLSACAKGETLISSGDIDLSRIPKEYAFEATHHGKYSSEPTVEYGKIVERVEHRCDKKGTLEYCVLKKILFGDPEDELFGDANEEVFVVTIVKDGERRMVFAKAVTINPYVNVGEFAQSKYMPFANNPDPVYLNTKFPRKKWNEFIKNPSTSLKELAPNDIGRYTKEELSIFNEMRFLPGLRNFVESLQDYLLSPIRKSFSICCAEQ